MSLKFESREYFEAEEYFEELSNLTDESEEFLDAQECSSEDSQIQNNDNESLLLHKLAFVGDTEELMEKLKECSEDDKTRLDKQGNTILHVGILRDNLDVLKVALDAGISSKVRNARGWSALDEAVATKRRTLVEALYLNQMKETKREIQKAKNALIQTLHEMPDYSMELNWQLGSPVIGYVLRKFAPHDTYKIYKTGSKIRVDGTLMGIEKNSSAMIPEWKRGDFSLLYDGTHRQSRIYLAFHKTKEYIDLTEEKQEMKKNTSIETGVDLIMADGVGKTKLRATDLRFKPIKGWLTSQQTERIEKWNTVVYEASAKMMAVTRLKSNLDVPADCTFEQYLNMNISDDKIVETAVLPSSISSQGLTKPPPSKQDSNGEKKVKPKKISGRCWMAEDFPMSLQQLLPLLDVVGHANKHLSRVSKFMRKYGDMNMFPVKIQVPLLLTVYLMLSFKKFKYSNNRKISMDLPRGYVRVKLEDVLSSAALGDLSDKKEDSADENKEVEALRLDGSNAIEY